MSSKVGKSLTQDEKFINETLKLARKGIGNVSPNPLVGSVIVKNRKILSTGYHKKFGGDHAEIEALKKVKDARGATLYVNLEPCVHYGKTPPCVESILEKGIKKVVIGMKDPNPLVSSKGIKYLEKHGIKVIHSVQVLRCRDLNMSYIKWIKTKKTFSYFKNC